MEQTGTDTSQEQEQTQVDPFTEKASKAGWRPLEEYDGDPEEWVDAKEFVKRAPLYEQMRKLKKENKEVKTTLHEVKGYITKVSQAAYNKAVADLTAQRDEAIDNGDRQQVHEIDKAIKDAEAIKVPIDNVHPAITSWEKENGEWFYADEKIVKFGKAYARNYLEDNPDDMAGALEAMEGAIKVKFPEKFQKPQDKRKDPPAVEGGKRGDGKKTYTSADLDDEARRVMRGFVRNGVMTEEEYIKGLVDSGAFGGKK
jgi:hypothetical protein